MGVTIAVRCAFYFAIFDIDGRQQEAHGAATRCNVNVNVNVKALANGGVDL
jgi:hypothetical protein